MDNSLKYINITSSQKAKLLQLYWELREAILNLNGISKGDFEFGELISTVESTIDDIEAPTMIINNKKVTKLQNALLKARVIIKRWVGFESVIGYIDSILSIVEELLASNYPVMVVPNETKQKLMELYSGMQVEIRKAYDHT